MDIQDLRDLAVTVLATLTVLGPVLAYLFRESLVKKFDDLLERGRIGLTHDLKLVEEMTKTFHQYALNSYMPVVQAATDLAGELDEEKEYEASFYRLVRYLRHYNQTLTAMYLPDQTAEVLLYYVNQKAREILSGETGFLNRAELIALGDGDLKESFSQFKRALQHSPESELQPIFDRYREWVKANAKPLRSALNCWISIMLFEINEGFKRWYGKNFYRLTQGDLSVINELLNKDSFPLDEVEKKRLRERYPAEPDLPSLRSPKTAALPSIMPE